ncbi:MAG: YczE/YyaS/YitT family protein [Bacillota bacterium]|jgi:uncharacterized membrane protein YczE
MSKKEVFLRKALCNILRYACLMLGFFLIGFSAIMIVKSGLGAAPWDVFHTGLTNVFPITMGTASIGAGVIFIIISSILGVKPYIGTILNMIFIGIFMDLTIYWGIFSVPDTLAMRIVLLVVGTFINALGAAIYFSANLKYGPRDSLMMAINKKTGMSIKKARTILEVSAIIGGWLMGGVFGLGTVFYALATGTFLVICMRLTNIIKKIIFSKILWINFFILMIKSKKNTIIK